MEKVNGPIANWKKHKNSPVNVSPRTTKGVE
jgi:hypothetical protein